MTKNKKFLKANERNYKINPFVWRNMTFNRFQVNTSFSVAKETGPQFHLLSTVLLFLSLTLGKYINNQYGPSEVNDSILHNLYNGIK
jgi:hypothetical protein